MAQVLSNTKRAAINLMIQVGNREFSFFDQGLVEGEGMWYSDMKAEMPVSEALAARAIASVIKDGFFVKSQPDEDGERWMGLTETGIKAALALKGETPLAIVEEEAAAKPRKASEPTDYEAYSGKGCHCNCGLPTSGKSLYRPGHDAKLVSNLVRAAKGANAEQQAKIQAIASRDLSQALFLKFLRGLGK